MMTIAIVIPTYNGDKYVYDALRSACLQVRPADEIIISDDGSTDNTLQICRSEEFKNRLQIYHNSPGHSGFVNAWNKAIDKSQSDYITLLHQDDLLDQNYLATIHKALERYPYIGHIYTSCHYIDCNGCIIQSPAFRDSLEPRLYTGKQYRHNYLISSVTQRNIHRCPGVTTKKQLFSVCAYREDAGHIADDDFFFRIGKHTDVLGIHAPLAYYRHHKYSETGRLNKYELTSRLARDYTFQSRFHSNCEYFDKIDVILLNKLAIRYINSLLYYGLCRGNDQLIEGVICLRDEMQFIAQCSLTKLNSRKYNLLWALFYFCEKYDLRSSLCYLIRTSKSFPW